MTDVGGAYTIPDGTTLADLVCTATTLILTGPTMTDGLAVVVRLSWPALASPPLVTWWPGIRWSAGPFVQPPQPSLTRGSRAWAGIVAEMGGRWAGWVSDPDWSIYTRERALVAAGSVDWHNLDGGAAATVDYYRVIDGGTASTTSWVSTMDGGAAA